MAEAVGVGGCVQSFSIFDVKAETQITFFFLMDGSAEKEESIRNSKRHSREVAGENSSGREWKCMGVRVSRRQKNSK